MARQFDEGAESGNTDFWDAPVSNVTNVTSPVRIGGRAYQFNNNATVIKTLPTATAEFYARIPILIASGQTLQFQWRNTGTILGSIRSNPSTQTFDIYTSTGTLALAGVPGIWVGGVYINLEVHVKIADAGGVIEFQIEGGGVQPSFTGDTKPGAATTVNQIAFNTAAGGFSDLDDFALNDVSGGSDNSWLGDGHYYAIVPSAAGDSTQFTPSTGNNWAAVDEIPSNGDTDYVEDATSGHKDLYNLTNLPALPAGSVIKRVVVEVRSREITADANSINIGVKGGTGGGAPSTESWSGNLVQTTSYARYAFTAVNNPATGAAWTETEVNNMQAGIKLP